MATVQNIIDRATERSNLNDASLISETELIAYVSSFEQRLYLEAARENPDYFGEEGNTASRAGNTSTWDISATPGNVGAVSRVEIAGVVGTPTGLAIGDEVSVVSIRNPLHGIAPRAYMRNRVIHEYNSEMGDDASNYVSQLKVWYSYLPTAHTATTDTLSLPEEYTSIVVLGLARVMALRDQRPDEVEGIMLEYTEHLSTFMQALGVFDELTIRELDATQASSRRLGA